MAEADVLTLAKQMVRLRRQRDSRFGELFGEPVWDMLLDLYIARCEDRTVAVSSACIGSGVAATTALRWLSTMVDAGLVRRTKDPLDLRRVFVALTDIAFSKVHRLLREAAADRRPGR